MIKIYKQGIKVRIKGEDVDVNVRVTEQQLKEIFKILYSKELEEEVVG